jgi:tetratricopeptide (TPR) repeat protein
MVSTLSHMPEDRPRYIVEQRRPFAASLIWTLQDAYFRERGVEAWRRGEVPHYVTSNPTIANAYAEIVFACRLDDDRVAPDAAGNEPLTICELGGGSGRFAFHFLKRLLQLCQKSAVAPQSFRYVLTDAAEDNLEFWRRHPSFHGFFAAGVLDVARFDVNDGMRLEPRMGGASIEAGSLRRPLVVVANYLFDSVPQDLFRFRDGKAFRCLVSLSSEVDPQSAEAPALLAALQLHYDYEPLSEPPYEEPELHELFAFYRDNLRDSHVLVPAAGLRCLRRLAALSQRGLVVLSADKGTHRLDALEGRPPPDLVRHGSFSLPVNYHALAHACAAGGGPALLPSGAHHSIDVVALFMLAQPGAYERTRQAYERHIDEFGPDSFFTITRHARETIPHLSADSALAYLRLSRYDSHQFGRYLPRLQELAAGFDADTRAEVTDAVEKVWELYFPLGEDLDLANSIACLFYAMDDYPRALDYFARSIEIYGRDTGTLYNMAACHHLLGDGEQAAALLRQVLEHDAGNEPAAALLAEITEAPAAGSAG